MPELRSGQAVLAIKEVVIALVLKVFARLRVDDCAAAELKRFVVGHPKAQTVRQDELVGLQGRIRIIVF